MKILFMADVPANPDSGAAGTEFRTIEALRSLGHHVEAVWHDGLPHKIKHGNLHYLFELPRAYEKQMLRRLRNKSYDVVHVNQPHGYRAARALSNLKAASVFIHRSHGVELRVQHDLSPWQKIYQPDKRSYVRKSASKIISLALRYNSWNIARFADGHIVSASQCGNFLHEAMGVPRERIAVISQAAPDSFLNSANPELSLKRLNHVLYVGQFAFIKAPLILARIFDRLAEANGQLRFTWVCARQHHEQARQLLNPKSRERVRFLDWMGQDELIKVYDRHGVFLFPSFFEGFGKAFLEAMSRGLCVVAADNGGAHDVVIHRVNGMLAPTASVDTMVNQCLELVNGPNLAFSISRSASSFARSFTWRQVALETGAFYQKILDGKREATMSLHERAIL